MKQLQKIETTKDGEPNGFVVPVWRADDGERIGQVYLTVVLPGQSKGPHLHKKRCGRFTCIKGAVDIITRVRGEYSARCLNAEWGFETAYVPPGVPAEIRCVGEDAAYLLNLPDPAWSAADPDEWPVENWNPSLGEPMKMEVNATA